MGIQGKNVVRFWIFMCVKRGGILTALIISASDFVMIIFIREVKPRIIFFPLMGEQLDQRNWNPNLLNCFHSELIKVGNIWKPFYPGNNVWGSHHVIPTIHWPLPINRLIFGSNFFFQILKSSGDDLLLLFQNAIHHPIAFFSNTSVTMYVGR